MFLLVSDRRIFARARRSIVFVFALAVLTSCGENTDPGEVIPVPSVGGIDKTTVSPGDTVTVTGSDFDGDPSLNRVKFNNSAARAVPFSGSTTQLRVVVHRNALSGPVSVSRAGQAEEGVGPEVTVVRGVGAVFVAAGSRSLDLPTPANAEYLVVPHAAAGVTNEPHSYSLKARELPPTVEVDGASGGVVETPGITIRESFESLRWDVAGELIARVGAPALPARRAERASEDVQQMRQFTVWNTTDDEASPFNTSNYTTVTAQLRYTGPNVLIYTDVDTLGTGNLTFSDIKSFAETFDLDIRPSNNKYFGSESDVDTNDKVIILITPVVNRLTPAGSSSFIGGFFFSIDLFSVGGGIPAGTSNHGEILYLLAADPGGVWGMSQPRAEVAEENLKTMVHEFEHLISFSYRLFFRAGAYQATWLEEAMAHAAEDLLWRETGDPKFNTSNERRGIAYRANPDGASIEDGRAPIIQRGAGYLFLRLLADRFGTGIFKQILQNDCRGRVCIKNITGEDFMQTFGEFLAAMYLSGRGINSGDRYNFDSIDLADFGALSVTGAAFDNAEVGNAVFRTSGDFFYFSGSGTPTSRFILSTTSTTMQMHTLFVRTR